jgi:hypothetical protein
MTEDEQMKNNSVAFGVTGNYCWWDHQCEIVPPCSSGALWMGYAPPQPVCDDNTPGLCEKAGNGEIVWMVAATEAGIEIVGMKL